MELDIIIRAVLAPTLVVLVVMLLLHWISNKMHSWIPAKHGHRHVALCFSLNLWMPILVVIPPIAAHFHLQPGFEWPCTTAYGWLPVSLLIGACGAMITTNFTKQSWQPSAVIVVAVCSTVVLAPPGIGGVPQHFVVALVATLSACGIAQSAIQTRAATFAALVVVAACASVMCMLSGFAKLSVVVAALSAGSATFAVAAMFFPSVHLGRAGATTFACSLTACMFVGAGYDESGFPWWTWTMLAISPALMSVSALRAVSSRPRVRLFAVVGAPAACAAGAVIAAVLISGAMFKQSNQSTPSESYSTDRQP